VQVLSTTPIYQGFGREHNGSKTVKARQVFEKVYFKEEDTSKKFIAMFKGQNKKRRIR